MAWNPRRAFFITHSQLYKPLHVLQVRTSIAPERLAQPVQGEIRALDPTIPIFDVTTMEEALGGGNAFLLVRIGALFASALGLLGLMLAVVGLYGVVSYSASQRTHEIGIRLALGAERRDILSLVVGHGLGLMLLGGVAGIVATLGLSRLLASMLFGIKAWDPLTYVLVTLVLAIVALAACYIPARRATRIDPIVALRYE